MGLRLVPLMQGVLRESKKEIKWGFYSLNPSSLDQGVLYMYTDEKQINKSIFYIKLFFLQFFHLCGLLIQQFPSTSSLGWIGMKALSFKGLGADGTFPEYKMLSAQKLIENNTQLLHIWMSPCITNLNNKLRLT